MNTCRRALRIAAIAPALCAKKSKVGGQALIEGVLMRSKTCVAWAVKRPDDSVVVEQEAFISRTKQNKILGIPVIRGAIYLYESLAVGFKALNRSAEIAYEEEQAPSKSSLGDKLTTAATFGGAILLAMGLFMYLPMALLTWAGLEKSAFVFNLLAGTLRVLLFLGYLFGIRMWKDIQRVFEYHGAEHKAIFTFEDGKELSLDNMRPYRTFHPRCGTSFLILVSLICILLFAVIDSLAMALVFRDGYPLLMRFLVHLALIPLVSGISYEALKLSDRFQHIFPVNLLILPGLWLQRITTRPPDDTQLTIAARALKAAL